MKVGGFPPFDYRLIPYSLNSASARDLSGYTASIVSNLADTSSLVELNPRFTRQIFVYRA